MQIKKIKFHQHSSYHDCDDCGMMISDIYTVSCKGFKFTHGEPAYCYGTEEGDIEVVLKELFQYLQSAVTMLQCPHIMKMIMNHM